MTMKRVVLVPVRSEEVEWSAVRAQGAGGQNVNKVATAIHLRFDIAASSLPDEIKAQTARTQEQNLIAALGRLQALVAQRQQARLDLVGQRRGGDVEAKMDRGGHLVDVLAARALRADCAPLDLLAAYRHQRHAFHRHHHGIGKRT